MILVLDLGSSSTRASLYDEQARPVPHAWARVPVNFAIAEDGRCEDDPCAAFERVVAVLDALHAKLSDATPPVTDVGISAYASSLVCLDERGAPLTPVYTYADTRCAEDARGLRAKHDEMAVLQRTGCRIRANYLPAKIAWIARTQPQVFRTTRWFASLSDFVRWRLFGRVQAGISVASWTGLLNRRASDWDEAWLDALGIARAQLPPIAQDDDRLEGLRPEWAARWPKFAAARSHPPIGDGAAANVGSGCVNPSRVAVTIGSTAAMRVVRRCEPGEPYCLPPSLWAYRVDHAHELIGGATTEGGNVFAWARRVLRLPDEDEIETRIAAIMPDGHGLTALPTLAGERSPGYAEDIRGTLHGLSLDTDPFEITRALLEGIAYRLAHICDALRASSAAGADAALIGSGGALQASPTWRQIIADVTGLPLRMTAEPEATSKGVALLMLVPPMQWEADPRLQPSNPDFEVVHFPDGERRAIYRAAMARQEDLYAKLVRSDR
ncbi:MAG: gluconokinase [Thermoflexales bacterium]|nr:gluconokinase [Thermoflexales bacterium]MDW8351436.1 gluconokinase [Anaerolineae bacterium]